MSGKTFSREIEYGIAGAGVRAAKLITYLALEILAKRSQMQKRRFRLKINVYEQQAGAGGNAFQVDCHAALNSSVPGRVPIPDHNELPDAFKPTADQFSNMADCVRRHVQQDAVQHARELCDVNPSAAAMFMRALDIPAGIPFEQAMLNANLDLSRAFTTRGTVGMCEASMLNQVLQFIDEQVPEMQVEFFYEHEVIAIDLGNPVKPKFIIRKNHEPENEMAQAFDFVLLATGPSWESPLRHAGAASRAFSGTPNHENIKKALAARGLLDDTERIRPGSRILITGTSLSAYDYVPIAVGLTPMKPTWNPTDPKCYEPNTQGGEQYKSLFTFVNRTDGEIAPPRHAESAKWPGSKTFLTTKEAHAVFLQEGLPWLPWLKPIIKANIAYELGMCPAEIDRKMTTKQRMEDYRRQTSQHLAGELTAIGLERAFYHALFGGNGNEKDVQAAHANLVAEAPITREGRSEYHYRRAAAFDVTRPDIARAQSNDEFFKHWKTFLLTASASPVPVQDTVGKLFEADVARHVVGSFNEIGYSEEMDKFTFKGQEFDFVFAPKSLTRNADKLLKAMKGKVQEVVPGQPKHAKGRILLLPDGTPTHAFNFGYGGHGIPDRSSGAKETMIGTQWTETTFYDSATAWAADSAKMMLLLGGMAAGHADNASREFLNELDRARPTPKEFDRETGTFKSVWKNLNLKRAYLQICTNFAKTGMEFRDYAGYCLTNDDRKIGIKKMMSEGKYLHAERAYNWLVNEIPEFKPVGLDQFTKRYIDPTREEIGKVWDVVFDACDGDDHDGHSPISRVSKI